MIQIKRLVDCTVKEALHAWNEGFKGYFFDSTMSADAFVSRLGKEGLSPSLSIVAFDEGTPVGIVVNGTRKIADTTIAWNGGTGVAPEYRKKGVGRQLIETSLEIYREAGVNIATLEALSQNEKAIALYEKIGYEVVDTVSIYSHQGPLPAPTFGTAESFSQTSSYDLKHGVAQEVQSLPFYQQLAPWQTQAAGILNGESLIAMDSNGKAIGYALYRRAFNESGLQTGITLFQCVADPEHADATPVLQRLLHEVYKPEQDGYTRTTFNFPESHQTVTRMLRDTGFELKHQQVYMMKQIA